MSNIKAVVFDMAGTTVEDRGEVMSCFMAAAQTTELQVPRQRILSMMGQSKRSVFEMLWREQLADESPQLDEHVDGSYQAFRQAIEDHYGTQQVRPTAGCLQTFEWLKRRGIAIGLTTGFYRKVTDTILERLGWDAGLNDHHVGGAATTIQVSVAGDEVAQGRPSPQMIYLCMQRLGIEDASQVVKVGDTPVDLEAGRNAGCGLSLAVTNGTHSAELLGRCDNDGLLASVDELIDRLERHV